MLVALICTRMSVERDLDGTVLWRNNIERRIARNFEEARAQAAAARPNIIAVDHRLPEAAALVGQLREDPLTRHISIVALAQGDFEGPELEMLQAGANAILRLPASPDWDDRLYRLIHVPVRKEIRFGVYLQVTAAFGPAAEPFPAQALNLSVNGMLIESNWPLGVGDDVSFGFQIPGYSGIINGAGTIVRRAGNHYGLELTHVHGDGRKHIREFVEGA